MRMHVCLLVAAVLGFAPVARAADDEMAETEDWRLTVGLVHAIYLFAHDALQNRADFENDSSVLWRDGTSEGNGWGARVAFGKGSSKAQATIVKSDYEYRLIPDDESKHIINTDRRDLDLEWFEATGNNDKAVWGWNLGFRYIGVQKRIDLVEDAEVLDRHGNINWYMIKSGYFGELHPFGHRYVRIVGAINVMLGEAGGLSREGNDIAYDGDIVEAYADKYSIAYGASGHIGMHFEVTRAIGFGVEYRREWMYSFGTTESGIVVFPDNDDARFIENNHAAYAYLDASF